MSERKCGKCQQIKPLKDFRRKYMPCISCDKKWHAENYKRNRKKILLKNAEWRRNNPERVIYHARQALLRHHKITQEDYDRMFVEQDGKCAICHDVDTGRKVSKLFLVDHRHSDGKVRGLLCHKCNVSIGLLKENVEIIQNVIKYLTKDY